MTTDLITSQPLDLRRTLTLDDVTEAIREEHQHAESTWRTWESCFRDFARFVGADTLQAAAAVLVQHGSGPANRLARAYRADMVRRDLSSSTVNLRLWSLRKAVDMARTLGLVDWTLDAPGTPQHPSRDVEGPGVEWVRDALRMLADDEQTPHTLRDRAIVRLIFDFGLRRGSVASLDLEHVDLACGRLQVRLKGRRERDTLRIPDATRGALAAWLEGRRAVLECRQQPVKTGPLFVALDRGHCGQRLTGRSIHRIISALGRRIGRQPVWPHALRHTAISYVADSTGDAYVTNAFAGHSKMSTTLRYIDRQSDRAFKGASLNSEVQ